MSMYLSAEKDSESFSLARLVERLSRAQPASSDKQDLL